MKPLLVPGIFYKQWRELLSTTYHIKTRKGVQCINITPYVYFVICVESRNKISVATQKYTHVFVVTYNLFLTLNLVSQTLWCKEAKIYVEFIWPAIYFKYSTN